MVRQEFVADGLTYSLPQIDRISTVVPLLPVDKPFDQVIGGAGRVSLRLSGIISGSATDALHRLTLTTVTAPEH